MQGDDIIDIILQTHSVPSHIPNTHKEEFQIEIALKHWTLKKNINQFQNEIVLLYSFTIGPSVRTPTLMTNWFFLQTFRKLKIDYCYSW